MLLGDMVISNALRYPDKTALVDNRIRLSWKGFNERVNKVANSLLDLGMCKGDRIAVVSDNCHQYAEALFASAKLGLICVCPNYRYAAGQLARMMDLTRPRAIIVQGQFKNTIESIRKNLSFIDFFIGFENGHDDALDYDSLADTSSPDEPLVELNEDDGHAICFSSGTTGEPKAALISHRNRFANAHQISVTHPATRNNVILLPLAMYTSLTQQYLFSYTFAGSTIVLINFTPEDYLDFIEREKIDTLMINYTLFNLVQEYLEKSKRRPDISSVTLLRSAGQSLSYEQWQNVLEFFPNASVIKGLGMTEAGVVTSGTPEEYDACLSPWATDDEKRIFNSLGKPLVGVRMRVVDEKDKDVPTGHVGEVIFKGDNVIKDFWNQPQITEEVLRDGWLHTGDMAMLDQHGRLYLMGRKDDRIRTGGYNVYPVEIEEIIARHPAVKETAVFGTSDERWGEMIMAAVILREGCHATEDELKEHCRKYLARFQVPKKMIYVKDFPRHPVWNRVLKKELAQQLTGRS